MNSKLTWKDLGGWEEAWVGTLLDGVRFTLEARPSCHRRGMHRLLVEVCGGENHHKWGCFDDQDQPMRYYHLRESAEKEAQAIADVLVAGRMEIAELEESRV